MLALFFFGTTVICGIGWLSQYICSAIFAWYIQEKGLNLPSDEEMRKGERWFTEHVLRDLGFGGKN